METSSASELKFHVLEKVQLEAEAYATERNYLIDFVMELASSQFLDLDGVTDDCQPVMSLVLITPMVDYGAGTATRLPGTTWF